MRSAPPGTFGDFDLAHLRNMRPADLHELDGGNSLDFGGDHNEPGIWSSHHRLADHEIPAISMRNVEPPRRPGSTLWFGEHQALSSPIEIPSDFVVRDRLGNPNLPIAPYLDEITQSVKDHQVSIIVGGTGSGKTTQVPQSLLEAGYDCIVAEPTYSAVRGCNNRLMYELAEKLGDEEAQRLVCMRTASIQSGPADARIRVETDGYREAIESEGVGFGGKQVLIIDEAHQAGANVSALMVWAAKKIESDPSARVLIMSATFDAGACANYFASFTREKPNIITVPGRLYPLEKEEFPNSTVAERASFHATRLFKERAFVTTGQNGILVFLPGQSEIRDTRDAILALLPTQVAKHTSIWPLYAHLPIKEQLNAIKSYPGVNIILSTNVSESSVTYPHVSCVIDCGLRRQIEVDDADFAEALELSAKSQAELLQAGGRASRNGPGIFELTRLNSKTRFMPFSARPEYPTPEFSRRDISRYVLSFATRGILLDDAEVPHAISDSSRAHSRRLLGRLGAMHEDGSVTEIGKAMAKMHVGPNNARMLVEGRRFDEETRAALCAIAAATECGGLQNFDYGMASRWRQIIKETQSDHLVQLELFINAQGLSEQEMRGLDLNPQAIMAARVMYPKLLRRLKVAPIDVLRQPTHDVRENIIECVAAGYASAVFQQSGRGKYSSIFAHEIAKRELGSRTVVTRPPSMLVGTPRRIEVYKSGEKVTQPIIESATAVTPELLGRVAAQLTQWESEGYSMRGGRVVQTGKLKLGVVDLGKTREIEPEPTKELQDFVVKHVLANKGFAQQQLRGIKSYLEWLAHRSKDPVPRLTQDMMVDLIERAAPLGTTNPAIVEKNLLALMSQPDIVLKSGVRLEAGVTLASFVTPEEVSRIIACSPDTVRVSDALELVMTYKNSRAFVQRVSKQDITSLPDHELFLPDGRQIKFALKNDNNRTKLVSLLEFKAAKLDQKS